MSDTCYMCDREKTSREHVPPKCLFPEKKDFPNSFDLRKNLISVPSCDIHNSHKSLDDEYLRFLLTSYFKGNGYKSKLFKSKVVRAIKRKPYVYTSFVKNVVPEIVMNSLGFNESVLSYQVDMKRFNNVIRHIACGLFYHHYKRKWLGDFVVNTEMLVATGSHAIERNIDTKEVAQDFDEVFSRSILFGNNQEIFSYKVLSANADNHVISMDFYEGQKITVLLMNKPKS